MDGKQKLLISIVFSGYLTPLMALPSYEEQDLQHHRTHLLNQFYSTKAQQPKEAESALRQHLVHHPRDVHALKEMGYWLMLQNKPAEALEYFERAAALSPQDYALHTQIGYLYDQLNMKRHAYYQFAYAAQTDDALLKQQNQQAMITLKGAQTQILPHPYFADAYLTSSYLSRFHDYIMPWRIRAGRTLGDNEQVKIYSLIQGNYDSQSHAGEVPIIYADNYTMLGAGIEYQPFKWPIYVYFENGIAYEEIILPDERRWNNDTRVGAYTYFDWGMHSSYHDSLTWSLQPSGDVYANYTYYSRYYHDWLGQLRIRPGIRALQYGYSSVDIYLHGELFADSKELYYNNMLLGGIGVNFIPDNRWPVNVRIAGLRGMYLPTPDSNQNPYDQYFNTLYAELVLYFNF